MKAVVFYESADDLAEKAPLHAWRSRPRPVARHTRGEPRSTPAVNTSCITRQNLATMSPVTAGPGGSRLAA
jgi:hypothetical protein